MTDIFSGELVYLKPVEKEDLELIVSWYRDYELAKLMIIESILPFSMHEQEIWNEEESKRKDAVRFSIYTVSNDRHIGICDLENITGKNRKAVLGIGIGDKEYLSKGYGTDAVKVLVNYGFMELNLNRIELWVFDYNKRAIRAYEKVGFVHEGPAQQAIYRDGAYHDSHLMAILQEDWAASG